MEVTATDGHTGCLPSAQPRGAHLPDAHPDSEDAWLVLYGAEQPPHSQDLLRPWASPPCYTREHCVLLAPCAPVTPRVALLPNTFTSTAPPALACPGGSERPVSRSALRAVLTRGLRSRPCIRLCGFVTLSLCGSVLSCPGRTPKAGPSRGTADAICTQHLLG